MSLAIRSTNVTTNLKNQLKSRTKHDTAKKSIISTFRLRQRIQKVKKTAKPMFDFGHERGAINPYKAATFVSLLHDIRNHLLRSRSTRAIFVSMAEKFFSTLSPDIRETFEKPTDRDFYEFICHNWPRFCTFNGPPKGQSLTWGYVEKGELEPNEISLLSSIVESTENAVSNTSNQDRLSIELYQLVMMVIIFHEMSHAFTKFWFNKIVTPVAVDTEKHGSGESGFVVEERLMGGILMVEWDDHHLFGDMDLIDRVVLLDGSSCWKIDKNMARLVLASLRGKTFICPVKQELDTHLRPKNTVRARPTQSTENPVPIAEAPSIGLEFLELFDGPAFSIIGHDKD